MGRVAQSSVERVARIYGFDWAAVAPREEGLGEMAAVMAPEFEARMSPELGGRVLNGPGELRIFGAALEQDFSQFSYDPREYLEAADGRVVVVGRVRGVGRASKMPLEGEFGHVWTLEDGLALRVEAFLDEDAARGAAGL